MNKAERLANKAGEVVNRLFKDSDRAGYLVIITCQAQHNGAEVSGIDAASAAKMPLDVAINALRQILEVYEKMAKTT